jgi:hypothetical protein
MKSLVLLLALVASVQGFAQTRVVSVDAFDLAYSGGLSFRKDSGRGPDRDSTNFRLNLNYAQNFEQLVGVMWKASARINRFTEDYSSYDRKESSFGVTGGLLFNFSPEDIKNSGLIGASVLVEHATFELGNTDDESGVNFGMILEAGKRFDLGAYSVANISYAPTVSFEFKRYGGDIRDNYFKSMNDLRFNFLKFDVLF